MDFMEETFPPLEYFVQQYHMAFAVMTSLATLGVRPEQFEPMGDLAVEHFQRVYRSIYGVVFNVLQFDIVLRTTYATKKDSITVLALGKGIVGSSRPAVGGACPFQWTCSPPPLTTTTTTVLASSLLSSMLKNG